MLTRIVFFVNIQIEKSCLMLKMKLNKYGGILMRTQEKLEREINLVDLFCNILLGWRRIICFALLFAVILSGVKYLLDVRSYYASQNVDIGKVEEKLEEDELEQLSDAIDLQKRIDEYENYQKKSAIMQIDPYAKPILELQYRVQSDYIINYTKDSERDYTPELTAMYCNYINSGEMAGKVIEEALLSVSQEDFVELVSVKGDGGSIFFTISYADKESLGKISDVVKSLMEQKSSEFQKVGSHVLQLINESQNVVVDKELAERKDTISNNVISLEGQLNNTKKSMSQNQLLLFDIEISEIRGEDLEEQETPGFSNLYVILGVLMGGFLACAWIACKMIFTSKLQSSSEIGSMYGVHFLGEIEISERKKRVLSVIDTLIISFWNRGKKKVTAEQQIKLISTNIMLLCRQNGIDRIYLTGSEYERADKVVLDKLKKELSKQNIIVQDGGNMLYDAASLQSGMESGNLVLVEQKGQSGYEEIYQELNMVKQYQKNVLGVIVLG